MIVLKRKSFCLILILFPFFVSCLKGDCQEGRRQTMALECLQIFEKLPDFDTYKMNSIGVHLITRESCICSDETRWLTNYSKFLQKGDTIIKRKGEMSFSIHKKDTLITVLRSMDCNQPDQFQIEIKGQLMPNLTFKGIGIVKKVDA